MSYRRKGLRHGDEQESRIADARPAAPDHHDHRQGADRDDHRRNQKNRIDAVGTWRLGSRQRTLATHRRWRSSRRVADFLRRTCHPAPVSDAHAFTNKAEGKGYALALDQLYTEDGFDTKDRNTMQAFTDVLWIKDDPERETILREIREAMSPGQRSRLNSPGAARQRINAVLKARVGGTEETLKGSPVSELRRRLADKERRIAELELKLARRDDGSLFDLKHDTVDAIAQAIVANVTDHKIEALVKAIGEHRKRKR